jgi:hypothetical protein
MRRLIYYSCYNQNGRGLPVSWDEIGPGHLVIAHESLEYGWWEAIVVEALRGRQSGVDLKPPQAAVH